MAENWEQYAVKNNDEWEQYAVNNTPNNSPTKDVLGSATGVGVASGAAYGLYKSKIPQNATKLVAKGVNWVTEGSKNIPKVVDASKGTAFAEEIRSSFVKAHSDKVSSFGKQIDELSAKYPKQSVSLQTTVDDLNTNWDELTPEVKSVIKKTPYLKNMVNTKNPVSTSLSLEKSQEVINYMNTKLPKSIRYNNLDVVDTINNIRGSQLEAFPEMEGVRADYKSFIEPYNQVKGQFRFNKLLNAIKNKFGGAEGQIAVEKILPKDVIKKMGGYRAAAKIASLPKALPVIGRALGVAPMALQAFNLWRLKDDPEAQYNAMVGGGDLAPKGSIDREIQQGRIL